MAQIKFHKVLALPGSPVNDALYFVQIPASGANGNRGNLYATDSSGNYHQITPPNGSTFSDEMKTLTLGYAGQTGGVDPRVSDNITDLQRDKIGYFTELVPLPTPTNVTIRYRTAEHPNANGTDHNSIVAAANTINAGVMTAADKVKLDSLATNYKGVYQDIAALNIAHATSNNGDWAIVLNAAGPAQHHSWDDSSSTWEAVDFASITGTTNLSYNAAVSQGTVTSDTGSDAVIPLVDSTNAGLMSAVSLAAISTNTGLITANTAAISAIDVTTNLSYTVSPTQGVVTSDTGTDATVPIATQINAGLMSPGNKADLDKVADPSYLKQLVKVYDNAEIFSKTSLGIVADPLDGTVSQWVKVNPNASLPVSYWIVTPNRLVTVNTNQVYSAPPGFYDTPQYSIDTSRTYIQFVLTNLSATSAQINTEIAAQGVSLSNTGGWSTVIGSTTIPTFSIPTLHVYKSLWVRFVNTGYPAGNSPQNIVTYGGNNPFIISSVFYYPNISV